MVKLQFQKVSNLKLDHLETCVLCCVVLKSRARRLRCALIADSLNSQVSTFETTSFRSQDRCAKPHAANIINNVSSDWTLNTGHFRQYYKQNVRYNFFLFHQFLFKIKAIILGRVWSGQARNTFLGRLIANYKRYVERLSYRCHLHVFQEQLFFRT